MTRTKGVTSRSVPNPRTHHPDGSKIRLGWYDTFFGSSYGYKKIQNAPSIFDPIAECYCGGPVNSNNRAPGCFG